MNTLSKRSLGTRIRERFRYGLATQEALDVLMRRLGILAYPYFVVAEGRSADFTSIDERARSFETRFLDDADMESLAAISTNPRSVAKLKNTLSYGRCLGIFVGGRLTGYSWSRFDRIPILTCLRTLMVLENDEAYLFDAFVSREFRGLRLAGIVRQQLYREMTKMGRIRMYSITSAFNRSSRRFKQKLGAKELELRLVLGISGWRAIDIRLRTFDDVTRIPKVRLLNLKTGQPKDAEINEAAPP